MDLSGPNVGVSMLPELPTRLTSQSNWLEYLKNSENPKQICYGGSEYPMYSDARVVGEISEGLGPYEFFNALPFVSGANASIVIVLRAFFFEPFGSIVSSHGTLATNDTAYHGGSFADEFAALVSLCLGIRLKSGEANRFFDGNDPYGRFSSFQYQGAPTLSIRPDRSMIPAPPHRSLGDIRERMLTIPGLDPRLYTELVRAARSYQEALWIAESDPHLSWLLLVSAVEIAANAHVTARSSPSENLQEFLPTLATLVEKAGGIQLLDGVAKQLKHLFGATKKFMRFCKEFTPQAPTQRPEHEYQRLEWTWPALEPILKKVYGLRSRALHAGVSFPAPMCERPERHSPEDVPSEKAVTGLALQTRGGQWLPEDAPITLHTFQHFVRGALLGWWDHIVGIKQV